MIRKERPVLRFSVALGLRVVEDLLCRDVLGHLGVAFGVQHVGVHRRGLGHAEVRAELIAFRVPVCPAPPAVFRTGPLCHNGSAFPSAITDPRFPPP